MATIRIQRDKGWVDMIRRYKIFLNGEEKRKFAIYSNLRGIKIFLAAFYSILGIFRSDIWIKIKEI